MTVVPSYLSLTWLNLTYSLGFLVEHRASATVLHRTRFCAVRFSSPQVTLHAFISSSHDLRQVIFGRPTHLFPCGFHSRAWRVMLPGGFLSEWPIHLHFLLPICCGIGSCFARCQRSWLLTLSDQWMFRMKRRHRLVKVCSLFEMTFVTFHVSDPYKSTDLTLLLKMRSLLLTDKALALHTGFSTLKTYLAFPIRALTSSSAPPVTVTKLPKYVKDSTSSSLCSPSVTGVCWFVYRWQLGIFKFICTTVYYSCLISTSFEYLFYLKSQRSPILCR